MTDKQVSFRYDSAAYPNLLRSPARALFRCKIRCKRRHFSTCFDKSAQAVNYRQANSLTRLSGFSQVLADKAESGFDSRRPLQQKQPYRIWLFHLSPFRSGRLTSHLRRQRRYQRESKSATPTILRNGQVTRNPSNVALRDHLPRPIPYRVASP